MAPRILFIIRHGEKPVPGDPSPGLTYGGAADPQSLTIRGWQRAGAWAALFGAGRGVDYLVPGTVYAADPSRSPDGSPPSQRPYQTVIPLAARLGLDTQARFAQGEEEALAADLEMQDGVVLVAWEHKRIVQSLLPLLLPAEQPGVPAKWHGRRFDVVFRLDRSDAGTSWSFRQMTPCLLAGDLAAPM